MFCNIARPFYHDTLPKKVWSVGYRNVVTGKIDGSYDNTGRYFKYDVDINMNADSLKNINSYTQTYFEELRTVSEDAYNAFTFGQFHAKASSKFNVSIFGAGYGITDRITAYFHIPFYSAEVNIDIQRTAPNNHQGVSDQIIEDAEGDIPSILATITENLPDGSGELLQSILVDYYGYQPIGTWKAEGPGDIEFGTMFRLTNSNVYGFTVTPGVIIPCGRQDNPDILQDVAFSDGQWDFFLEFSAGFLPWSFFGIENLARLTYQFSHEAEVRLPENEEFLVTKRKERVEIQPGSKFLYMARSNFHLYDWFTVSPGYLFEYQGRTDFRSNYPDANEILKKNTNRESHTYRLELNFSTIKAYEQQKFSVPFTASVSGQSVFAGANAYKYDRIDFEIRFFYK